ncbi:MAG: hypothetical protein H8K11_05120 [Nitrospira sp.]|nr:hypothetical protein [Nitrospira sp.]
MSAIASFIKLPKTAIEGLRQVALPRKRLFGTPRDSYLDYLQQHGQEVADYQWSGFVLGTLLPYLDEQHQITLMDSEYDELGKFLTDSRKATHFIFTDAHKRAFLSKLDGQFSEQAMRDYFCGFNETDEPDAGKWMFDGIQAFRQSLSTLDESSVIIFSIG